MKSHFSKDNMLMENKHLKTRLAPLIIREN